MRIATYILTILMLCLHIVAYSGDNANINTVELESRLDSLLQPLVKDGLISGSVLIAVNDNVVLENAYGMSDIEAGISNTVNTKFQIASITKMFTAVSILQSFERKQIDLQDKLSKYIPDMPNGKDITIYHLLTHTSGIPSYNSVEERNTDFDGLIQKIKKLPIRFSPGEKAEYSNSNMVLLTYILEMISGSSYEEYLKENIFKPCGMDRSGLLLSDFSIVIDSLANGYTLDEKGSIQKAERIRHAGKGDGSLYSTTCDLFKFSKCISDGTLISFETRDLMFKPFKKENGQAFGIGCIVEDYDDWRAISHDGGAVGVRTRLVMYTKPTTRVTVIMLFNTDFMLANVVNRQIENIALNRPWVPVFHVDQELVDSFNKFVGLYEISSEDTVAIGIEDGRVFYQENNQERFTAYVYLNNAIYVREINSRFHFSMDEESGKITFTGFICTPVSAFMVTGSRIEE